MSNNKLIFAFTIYTFLISSLKINPVDLQTLPNPYNSLKTLLPFDDHGWYLNSTYIKYLFENNKINVAIEVGSWLGKSTRHICSLLPETGILYAVDTWKGSIETEQNALDLSKVPTLYEQFLSNIIHANMTHKIIPIRMTSLEASQYLCNLKQQVDFIYIDAAHDTESVFNDMQAWYPYISGKRGILCGDDWTWESVRIAVRKFAQQYNVTICAGGNFWFILENNQCNEYSFMKTPLSIWQIIT